MVFSTSGRRGEGAAAKHSTRTQSAEDPNRRHILRGGE
jgi:hypothetical protein